MVEAVRFNKPIKDEQANFSYLLHNDNENGWWHAGGDPELWRYSERLLVKGGKILDLGIGFGRASLFFALQDMQVTGIDSDKFSVEVVNNMASGFRLPMKAEHADVRRINLGHEVYDTVLMSQLFVHFPSKKDAFAVIDKTLEATKPGGYIWLRAVGKNDHAYKELSGYAESFPYEVQRVDNDVFNAPCSCSGERKIEPQLFFNQTELLTYFNRRGLRIVHNQVLPQKGEFNIMYGEDWEPDMSRLPVNYGSISILAQKKK